jgi:RNA polymerase sigma-70 factor (ECF subfamily)
MSTSEQIAQWIELGARGDELACAALFHAYYPQVFRLSLGLLNDWADAEEVAQDSFVYAFRNLARFEAAKSAFRTWLFTIALSRCRNKRRRKLLELIPLEALNTETVLVPREVEQVLERRGVRRQVWQAIQALPGHLREAVVLRYLGEMRFKEVGEVLQCTDRTAEARARTALAALRQTLQVSDSATELVLAELATW